MKTIEEKAREHCNISKGLIIDEDERYYRDFQKYDGFKAGMEEYFKTNGLEWKCMILPIDNVGAVVSEI